MDLETSLKNISDEINVCKKRKRKSSLIYVPAAQGYESCHKLSGLVVSLWGQAEREDHSLHTLSLWLFFVEIPINQRFSSGTRIIQMGA